MVPWTMIKDPVAMPIATTYATATNTESITTASAKAATRPAIAKKKRTFGPTRSATNPEVNELTAVEAE